MQKTTPFIFGAHYYRAPTPEPEYWEADLSKMKSMGFNMVKYFVQWRWSHRRGNRLYFDDLDRLMDLAQEKGLGVTLNVLFDMAPSWLFEQYPDAKQIMNNGHVIEPYVVSHRQIGGHPGPCYNHPGARQERVNFMTALVDHFKPHPALQMWDVWNEPELSFPQRTPDIQTLACYCDHCRGAFLGWLKNKYPSLDALNQVWGRCYEIWEDVELPRSTGTFSDFIDWREFHIDTMTAEAAWRLQVVHQQDAPRVAYLHVVPNTMAPFNAVTCCADDFDMAKLCDVFAATMNGGPSFAPQVLSAARGKLCYNVESHINHGVTSMHQRILGLPDVLADLLPQVGLGIRGFLFWQFRGETLGFEAPAWGVVNPDGSDRPVTAAIRSFWEKLLPHADTLLACPPRTPQVGIWKSRKNEIFHFSIHGSLENLSESVDGYTQALYWSSFPYRFISMDMLAEGDLDDLKLLILPSPYALTEAEAASLTRWVENGGVLLAEAHLAGYNANRGRHSSQVPGCGLAEALGIHELDSTSSYHLKLGESAVYRGALSEDVKKALAGEKLSGGKYFPIQLADQKTAWGALRYATLGGEGITQEGSFDGSSACLVSKPLGKGWVYYMGTNLSQGAIKDPSGFHHLLGKALKQAGLTPTLEIHVGGSTEPGNTHVDSLYDGAGQIRYMMTVNRSEQESSITLDGTGTFRGIFSGLHWNLHGVTRLVLPGLFTDLWVKE